MLSGKNPLIEYSLSGKAAGHIRYFVKNSINKLLEENNFQIVEERSDIFNIRVSGKYFSTKLAKFFPRLESTIILKARNSKL